MPISRTAGLSSWLWPWTCADAARPWIEAAKPDYPCLIDRDHHVADLYNMVNVPQAVWIDEEGRIVRPPENAGSSDCVPPHGPRHQADDARSS